MDDIQSMTQIPVASRACLIQQEIWLREFSGLRIFELSDPDVLGDVYSSSAFAEHTAQRHMKHVASRDS